MKNTLSITGHKGEIRWVYLNAITFGPWSYSGYGKTGILTAQIVSVDEYRSQQKPLVAVVPAGRSEWKWNVSDLQISGSSLTATLERL